jgi:hypothetical protein
MEVHDQTVIALALELRQEQALGLWQELQLLLGLNVKGTKSHVFSALSEICLHLLNSLFNI